MMVVAKKAAAVEQKKENRIVRYLKEVRAEVRKVVWPSRRTTINLTMIVLAVTTVMSISMGLIDWIFSRLFALIIS
ncbi:MAG: preprotein translocase subunit SecE [Chloroflexi bacterium RBG_13_56_8]|nr:MAG: preprotein translocase subunit SecE [Chloroflexi bacterium RBG_13_56_8]